MSEIDEDSTVTISDLVDSVSTLLENLANADFDNLGQFIEDLAGALDVSSAITTITDALNVYSNLETALRLEIVTSLPVAVLIAQFVIFFRIILPYFGVTSGDTDFVNRYAYAASLFLDAIESTLDYALGNSKLQYILHGLYM